MKDELQTIINLMQELQDKMQYGEDDFSERLGRKKPDLEVVKIGMDKEPDGDEGMNHMSDDDEMAIGMDEPESPEEKLKKRLMKLRG